MAILNPVKLARLSIACTIHKQTLRRCSLLMVIGEHP